MSVASLTVSPVAGLLGLLARMLLAGGALAWVVGQAGPADSTAVIHVTETDVVVSVDDEDYTIEGHCPAPIVVELSAGDHTLVMRRGAETLHAEEFTLPRGKSIVLTAWASRSVNPAGRLIQASLAVGRSEERAVGGFDPRATLGRPRGSGAEVSLPSPLPALPPAASHSARSPIPDRAEE